MRPKSNDTARSYGARLLAWRPSDLQSTILRHSHSAVLAQRQRTGDAFAAEPALWCHEVLRAAAAFHLVRVRVPNPNPNPNPNQVLRAAVRRAGLAAGGLDDTLTLTPTLTLTLTLTVT